MKSKTSSQDLCNSVKKKFQTNHPKLVCLLHSKLSDCVILSNFAKSVKIRLKNRVSSFRIIIQHWIFKIHVMSCVRIRGNITFGTTQKSKSKLNLTPEFDF